MLYEQTSVNIRESISLYDLTWQLAHAGHLVPLYYVFYILTVHMYVNCLHH
jgi:hypothetical protein